MSLDFGTPAVLGNWYRVEFDVDVQAGTASSRITDLGTDTVVADRTDSIPSWTPADGPFDSVVLLAGEWLSASRIANLSTVDNIRIGPVDEECPTDFDGDGATGVIDLLQLLAGWGACP